ncbi:biotin-dependent enzyme [Micromonospora kangleipakensis]|uniref:Biotin-dependent enzyme n=2 Tax=Micromonosporaceae TaxID=28056 RepID=A0A4Q8BK61_9ACTN|nr:biotin-dependent enzyme [Micromonospora kangleipakensis]
MPWFAALFLRAFFLRDFFAILCLLVLVTVRPRASAAEVAYRSSGPPGVRGPTELMLVRVASPVVRRGQKRRGGRSAPGGDPGHDWIPFAGTPVEREGRHMAEEIRAEMVANVWKVVASAGDTVSEGDTLVILESMKMEIPVIAESDGVVQQMAVNEGDVVQDGDLIAVIG